MRHLLLPFSWLYGLGMTCRNRAYDSGLVRSVDAGVPVISVGNMVMGGTGKTPLVEYIVGYCLGKARKVAVVSRGYRRKSKGVVVVSDGGKVRVDASCGGDEPVQIARKYPGVLVVVGERRVEAAQTAVRELKADTIVMDDGFQHRSLRRGLDIVVLDSRKDLRLMPMIPAGKRREPLRGIRRAHLVALSHADLGADWWTKSVDVYALPVVRYRYMLHGMMEVHPDGMKLATGVAGKNFFLFSGIEDHQGFVEQMQMLGYGVVGNQRFPDHHSYSVRDIRSIARNAREKAAGALLTTEKDAVRLLENTPGITEIVQQMPLFYAGITVDVMEGKEILESMIDGCLAAGRA